MMWNVKFIKYRENKLTVTTHVHLWLKHKLASVLAIGQLYHQSDTVTGCTTQLPDVRGPATFCKIKYISFVHLSLQTLWFLFIFSSYQEIPKSVAEHRSLSIPINFNQNLPVIYLSLHESDVMNKIYKIAYLPRVFISVFRYVKIIKIHQDFPELWQQMYCHLFMVHSVFRIYPELIIIIHSLRTLCTIQLN